MNVRILGAHSSESRFARCISILVDDVLAIDAGGLSSGLSIPEQLGLRAILLTHQHYDHIRDLPILALNLNRQGCSIKVYCMPEVRDVIDAHLLNDQLYPRFHWLPEAKPTLDFSLVKPYEPQRIEGYEVRAIPVNHCDSCIGYQVTNPEGKVLFFTSDTGPDLKECWKQISPQLLITEVTMPNRYEELATNTSHLTPSLLRDELREFRKVKGYLPRTVVVHMDPSLEKEIEAEIRSVSEALHTPITLAYEGMDLRM